MGINIVFQDSNGSLLTVGSCCRQGECDELLVEAQVILMGLAFTVDKGYDHILLRVILFTC